MAKTNRRVVRYKAPININVGIVIFGIIFLYVAINVIIFFATERVTYYEVVEGSVADDSQHSYTAIALRKENVSYADNAGYINFYARENSRVSKNTTLYSIDESGRINELLGQMSDEEKKLSDDNITTIKEQLYSFVTNYNEMNYSSVYDFKNSLQGTVVELVNMNALQSIYDSLGASKTGQFEIKKADNAGIIEYTVDNYEDLTPKKLKSSLFDKNNYTSARIESGDIVEDGAPIYKTVTQEEWSLAIQLSEEDAQAYKNAIAVDIRFKKDNTSVTTNFEIVKGSDKKSYGILTLQKYMIKYADERFLDIEITERTLRTGTKDNPITTVETLEGGIQGLKVPKKSVINKKLYVIPVGYKTRGGNSNDIGFLKRTYDKAEVKESFTPATILNQTDEYCFVSMDEFEAGDEIILPAQNANKVNSDFTSEEITESSEDKKADDKIMKLADTYVVKDTQTLQGVYNINNGYTQFVFVEILAETGDYYIVKSKSKYGLVVYDHIILNGNKVKENQVIFQ